MPSARPRASFEAIDPLLHLDALVEETPNFIYADRISCDSIDQQGLEAFDELVLLHVIIGGKPLIIDGYEMRLDPWTFSAKWLQDNHGEKVENARDLRKDHSTTPMTIAHYVQNMGMLAEQYFDKPDAFRDLTRQRVYLKDIDCPDVWQDKLREHLPPNLFYLNDNTGELGGPGSVDETLPALGGKRRGKGIAGAGDLMSSLPPPMRAQNLMCYIGHEGTYTPAHREMCATIGHNIMVEASRVIGSDGKPERPGSSIWFMTESKDRKTVSEYWLSILGHDIEVEKHFAQINAWKRAPFTTYIVDQRPGDFILIPPMAPHQVWNRGTRTMKVAWNRTTVETLELAFKEALPNARLVCRDEQYKNKAIVYYTLQKYSTLLLKAQDQQQTASSPQVAAIFRSSPKFRQLRKDFKRLLGLFKQFLLSEMFSPDLPPERSVEFFPFDSNITCAYCRGNIFNRFLTCKTCDDQLGTGDPEPYDICMDCYTMGRSCGCISKLKWAEQFKWKDLVQKYELWRRQYLELDGGVKKPDTLWPLQEERERLQRKTLAQICQEQLKCRPWVDVHKLEPKEDESEEEIDVNDDGTIKKKKKKRSEAWLKNHHACHVCCNRHEKWKMAACECGRHWCYGTLFRGYDQMPQDIMADLDWKCPHCMGVCFAGACRKNPRQTPYEPKGTLLGHDTRKVADARSVESLVDFGVSNLNFLKESVEAPAENARLRRRQEEAERSKAQMDGTTYDQHYATDGEDQEDPRNDILYSSDRSMIDPRLGGGDTSQIDPSLPSASYLRCLRHSSSNAPNLPASPNSDLAAEDRTSCGYQPAQPTGYVATPADIFRDPDANGDEDEDCTLYPNTGLESGKKRKRTSDDSIKPAPLKKSRRTDGWESHSGATKQYRKEQKRIALEEARKAGRFIQMQAALRGRTKMVNLKLGRSNMARIAVVEATKGLGNHDLLKSDIAPADLPQQKQINTQSKTSNAVDIRVERDDDFDSRGWRRRERKYGAGGASKPLAGVRFEEVEIDSEKYDVDEEDTTCHDGALEVTESGVKRRRASAWQSKRHGDDDEPAALPCNFKDRTGKPNRAKPSPSSPAGKTISLKPTCTNGYSSEGHSQLAAATLNLTEKARETSEPDNDEEDSDENMKGVAVKGVIPSFPTKNAASILRRTGSAGKKIKIVGSKSHATAGSKAVNK